MNSKISLIAIAIIGLMFLSMPANAEYLSHHTSAFVLTRSAGCIPPVIQDSTWTLTDEIVTPQNCFIIDTDPNDYLTFYGLDSYMDLGATNHLTTESIYANVAGINRHVYTWGSNSISSGFVQIGDNFVSASGWNNISLTPSNYRYLRFSNDIGSGAFQISEIDIFGSPPPTITSWANSFTNNASLNLNISNNPTVIFSVLTVNQSCCSLYTWTYDGVNQNNNFSSFSVSVSNVGHTLSVTVTNTNGTSSPITWNINSGGLAVPSPIIPIPSSGNYIIPDQASYSLNSIATLFWGVDPSILNVLRQIDIDIQKPDGSFDTVNGHFGNVQTDNINSGTVSYQLTQSGKYKAILGTCLLTCFGTAPGNKVVLASWVLNVTAPQPYIIAPSNVLANQWFTIQYSFDKNLLSNLSYGYVDIQNSNDITNEQYITAVIDDQNHVITNATVHTSGTYVICLAETGKKTNICAVTIAATGTLPPTRNISTSSVSLSKSTYYWNDVLEGFYAIDNTNYSVAGKTLFWDIYNTDMQIESMYGYIGTQAENFTLTIKNDNYYFWDGKAQYLPSAFYAGNNLFRIFAKNDTSTTQIVNGTFALTNVNSRGYGLKLSKYNPEVNEPFNVFVVSPTSGTVKIIPSNPSDENDIGINGSVAFTVSIPVSGIANIYLYDNSNQLQVSASVNVTSPTATATPPPFAPGSSESTTVSMVDGWVGLMGLGVNAITKFLFAWFWITIFAAIGLARSEGKPLMGTIFALFPFGFFVFIAYLPVWFVIVIILEVLVATRVFK